MHRRKYKRRTHLWVRHKFVSLVFTTAERLSWSAISNVHFEFKFFRNKSSTRRTLNLIKVDVIARQFPTLIFSFWLWWIVAAFYGHIEWHRASACVNFISVCANAPRSANKIHSADEQDKSSAMKMHKMCTETGDCETKLSAQFELYMCVWCERCFFLVANFRLIYRPKPIWIRHWINWNESRGGLAHSRYEAIRRSCVNDSVQNVITSSPLID